MNKKSSNFGILVMLLACMFAFYSCDKIKDATTTEIKVASLSIELDEITVDDGSTTKSTADDDGLNYFTTIQKLSLDDIEGLSEDAIKYRSQIESVEAGPTSITITTIDSVGTVVKEFVLGANGVATAINVAQYNLGDVYTGDNLQSFAQQLLMKLFLTNEATLNTSGKTDITSGEKLRIKITVEDVTLIAGLM
jgi:hypothetical protein